MGTLFKQLLLTTSLGNFFLNTKDKIGLIKSVFTSSESLGTKSNDILSTQLITQICQSNKVFIDIGAHIGSIISEVKKHDNSIKIIAVEPIPEKVANLKKYFPYVEIYEYALGDENTNITFYINKKYSGYSSVLKPNNTNNNNIEEITVSLKRLDDISQFENIDAIKIDVEGNELNVIKGAKDTINKNRPIIMFESALGEDKINEELFDIFSSLEYRIHLPNRLAHNDNGLSKSGFIDAHVYPRYSSNFFAVPSERRIEFRDKARKILQIKS